VLDDCLVTSYVACRPLEPGDVAGAVEEIARDLRAFHECGVRLPSRFHVPDLLDDYAAIVRARGGTLPAEYAQATRVAASICAALGLDTPRPCHDDLLAGNMIRAEDGGRILLVDWEYAGMGDPRFDLGNLAVNNAFDEVTEQRLLRAYYEEPPTDAQRAALKLMRVLSDAREGAWGVVQGAVSELDFDFGAYAHAHFERLGETVALEDFEDWLTAVRS
jgi:thiamine kinase-like enzyme